MRVTRNKTSNRFCGPAAISALTGVHVDDAARTLRILSHRQAIKGVSASYMTAALAKLGWQALSVPLGVRKGKPTLTQALAGVLRDRKPAKAFLVGITGHWVVIQGRKLYDNRHPEGIFLGECPYRRKRVTHVWAVELVGAQAIPPPPVPMSYRAFAKEVEKLGLTADSNTVDAPNGYVFTGNGIHCSVLTTEDWQAELDYIRQELLPLALCGDLDCDVCQPDGTCCVEEIRSDYGTGE
jgi:hypothetical protein